MKVVCAWCQQAGHLVVLRELGPENGMVSHGICKEHTIAVMTEARLLTPRASALDRRDS
jgi:hypothetical protein